MNPYENLYNALEKTALKESTIRSAIKKTNNQISKLYDKPLIDTYVSKLQRKNTLTKIKKLNKRRDYLEDGWDKRLDGNFFDSKTIGFTDN